MSSLYQNNNPQRHKLTHDSEPAANVLKAGRTAAAVAPPPGDPILTIEELRDELQDAMQLELSTIPPYLTALYSIREGTNPESVKIIRSVVVEEMLHLVMVANLINALGGKPDLRAAATGLHYPTALPRIVPTFEVGLLPFSKEAIKTFMRIELPQPPSAGAKLLKTKRTKRLYDTIGAFYQALREAIQRLERECKERNPEATIFIGDKKLQVQMKEYYGSGGQIVPVHDLKSAMLVIDEIEGQGEGIDDTIMSGDKKLFGEGIEYAHYFRFNEIYEGRYYRAENKPADRPTGGPLNVDWNAVLPMRPNAKLADFKDQPEVYALAQSFVGSYATLIANIHLACNGMPEKMQQSMALMYELRYKATALMNIPVGKGQNAAPVFDLSNWSFQ